MPEHFNAYNKAKINEKAPTMTACVNRQSNSAQVMSVLKADGKTYPIYEVKDGQITKDKQYPIDGLHNSQVDSNRMYEVADYSRLV